MIGKMRKLVHGTHLGIVRIPEHVGGMEFMKSRHADLLLCVSATYAIFLTIIYSSSTTSPTPI